MISSPSSHSKKYTRRKKRGGKGKNTNLLAEGTGLGGALGGLGLGLVLLHKGLGDENILGGRGGAVRRKEGGGSKCQRSMSDGHEEPFA